MDNYYDFIIIGSGFSGATSARLLAEKGYKILIIERKNHIGGQAYDKFDEYGNLIHVYGPHIFHTNNFEVYSFINRFTRLNNYKHEIYSKFDGEYYNFPLNFNSIGKLEAMNYIERNSLKRLREKSISEKLESINIINLINDEDSKIQQIGRFLYSNFFQNYTEKQWGKYANEIGEDIFKRVSIKLNYNSLYFTDKWQGIPKYGYSNLFDNILDHKNIKILLNTNFNDIKDQKFKGKIIYTGCIDSLFDYIFGVLPFRTINFSLERKDKDYQTKSVINYPEKNYQFTRISDYNKMIENNNDGNNTLIAKEYSKKGTINDECYYPIPLNFANYVYKKYVDYAREKYGNKIIFLGRLGKYKYINMDIAIKEALKITKNY